MFLFASVNSKLFQLLFCKAKLFTLEPAIFYRSSRSGHENRAIEDDEVQIAGGEDVATMVDRIGHRKTPQLVGPPPGRSHGGDAPGIFLQSFQVRIRGIARLREEHGI